MAEMKSHTEQIICPNCGAKQTAVVEHTEPWWSYVHQCDRCGYIIMESEWYSLRKGRTND